MLFEELAANVFYCDTAGTEKCDPSIAGGNTAIDSRLLSYHNKFNQQAHKWRHKNEKTSEIKAEVEGLKRECGMANESSGMGNFKAAKQTTAAHQNDQVKRG